MKEKDLKHLREVAVRVLDKYEEVMEECAEWEVGNPRRARMEALHEIDEYLRNLATEEPG